MARKSAHGNVKKRCDCARPWACLHPWYIDVKAPADHATRAGERYRVNLDNLIDRHCVDLQDAQTEGRRAIVAWLDHRDPKDLQPGDRPTLAALIEQYERRPQASAAGKYQIRPITEAVVLGRPFGTWRAEDITREALDAFRQQRPLVAANRNLAYLRALFNWAVAGGLVPSTPFRVGHVAVVRLAREAARSRRLQGDEERRLLAAARGLVPLITAALETGCRLGELLSLQWAQVRFTPRAELFLPAQKTKAKKDRRVPISSALRAVLDARRHDPAGDPLPPAAYVFGDEIGRRRGSIQTAWELTCQRAGLTDLHFHDLRREAGSRWMDAGVPLATIQRWLGHHNISQTSTYLAASLGGDADEMRLFEQRIGRVAPVTHGDLFAGSNGHEPTASSTPTAEITNTGGVLPEAVGVH
jgi:integrase